MQLIDADDVKDDGSVSLVAPYHKPYDFVVNNDSRSFADLLTASGWISSRPTPTPSALEAPTS